MKTYEIGTHFQAGTDWLRLEEIKNGKAICIDLKTKARRVLGMEYIVYEGLSS